MTEENIVQRIVNAWDCCGTCAGGVHAAYVRDVVERAKAEALREAADEASECVCGHGCEWHHEERGCQFWGNGPNRCRCLRDAVTAVADRLLARADSLAAQPAPEEGCSSCGLYGGGHAHPDCEGAQAATVEEPHCSTCTCGCTCGYGGLHDPENPNCDLVRRKP